MQEKDEYGSAKMVIRDMQAHILVNKPVLTEKIICPKHLSLQTTKSDRMVNNPPAC